MKKIIFLMLFATLGWQHALAQSFTVGGINYNITSPTTVSVGNQYQSATGAVTLTSQVTNNGVVYSVTSISYPAFKNCYGLTSITIPNSVTSIGYNTFEGCQGLSSVIIPNSVTSISYATFKNCQSLTSVTIPNSVTSIENYAFENCNHLTSITIPNSVTDIGDYAFGDCYSLTSVTIPNSVTSIGSFVFQNCSALTSVTIPNSLTSISDNAFEGCSGLTSLTIPNSVTNIGHFAFAYCFGLTSVTIPNSVTTIGHFTFFVCSSLTSVTIPNSVTSIGYAAFAGCDNLTSVTIPNSVTSIGDRAFGYCSGLTSFIIPNSVTSIGNSTFQNCTGLTSVIIPNSVTSIGDAAFQDCSALTSVTIPNSVTSIGDAAFLNCTGLTSVVCNIVTPLSIIATVFNGVNQGACSLLVPGGSLAAYQAASIWQNFMVSPSSINPITKVRANLCGITLAAINTQIAADVIPGVQMYRFEVTNGTTVSTFEATKYNFDLTKIAGTAYATSYSIKVALKIAGFWGNYGQACSVTTPNLTVSTIPTTQIRPSFCGATLAALNTKIPASIVYNAEGYRFEITANSTTTVYDSDLYNFRLADAGIVAVNGTTYAIRVAAKVNGVYGNYGPSCNVTTPGVAPTSRQMSETTSIETIDFSLMAYPNPSNSTFKLQVNGADDDSVSILVFDMMGRQIENKAVNANDIENISIGQNYAIGIYNVIVSQGINTKTVRLVKN